MPEHLRQQSAARQAEKARAFDGAGDRWLAGIAEVELTATDRLSTIVRTEEARRKLQSDREGQERDRDLQRRRFAALQRKIEQQRAQERGDGSSGSGGAAAASATGGGGGDDDIDEDGNSSSSSSSSSSSERVDFCNADGEVVTAAAAAAAAAEREAGRAVSGGNLAPIANYSVNFKHHKREWDSAFFQAQRDQRDKQQRDKAAAAARGEKVEPEYVNPNYKGTNRGGGRGGGGGDRGGRGGGQSGGGGRGGHGGQYDKERPRATDQQAMKRYKQEMQKKRQR
jgi:hypothetical protein